MSSFAYHWHLLIGENRHLRVYVLVRGMLVLTLVPYLKISLFIIRSERLTTTAGQLLQLRKTDAFDKGSRRHRPSSSKGRESSPYWLVSITHLIKGTTYFQMLRAGAGAIHKTHIERSAFTKFALMFLHVLICGGNYKNWHQNKLWKTALAQPNWDQCKSTGAMREGNKQPLLH